MFPWKFIDSPYYKSLVNYPPENVEFINVKKNFIKVIDNPNVFTYTNKVKSFVRKVAEVVKVPNLTFTLDHNADLIHCAHCLLLNKLPWVIDLEHYWSFSASSKISYSAVGKSIIRKVLRKSFCKKILPWTYAAKETISEALRDGEIDKKMEVVYPAIPVPKNEKKKKSRKLTLLFIGRYFYSKGGLLALEAFRELKKRYDIKCILISLTIPEHIKKKYESYVEIHRSVSEYTLFNKIYPSSDIYVYPGISDTFGFSLLEAMSFNLPIITLDAFSRKEIVKDWKNGFVISYDKNISIYKIGKKEKEVVKKIVEKTSILIQSSSLRRKMGRYGRMLVEKGKFSIKKRNESLKRIYEEAINY